MINVREEYDKFKAEATRLAGGLYDIPRRVTILTHLYDDSLGNHVFPQLAAHGALWALSYFEIGGSLGRLIARRYFYNPEEKAFRLDLLRQFSDSFRRVNRSVCIDAFTNYEFTKHFGHHDDAAEVVPGELLTALNRVHAARQQQTELTPEEKRAVFHQSFLCEQEVTVAPGVQQAVAAFDCPIMKFLCLHPIVRFAYFPSWRWLLFRDFSNTEERINKGLKAFDYAQRMGWDHVQRSLRYYGHMPLEFFSRRDALMTRLRENPDSIDAVPQPS